MTRSRLAALAVAFSAMAAPPVFADLLAIDYNYTGDSSPTQTGFSGFAMAFSNGIDVTNTYEALTVRTEADSGTDPDSLAGAFDRGTFASPTPLADLYRDYAFNNDGALNITISGLIGGQHYGLTLYSFDNSPADGATIVTTFTPISGTLGSPATVTFTDGVPPTTAQQYAASVVWTANGSGDIAFTVLGSGSGVASSPIPTRTNGFELVLVPEPSSLGLAAVGALGLVAWANRRRHRA